MKYSPEIVKKICDLLKMGNYIHTACDCVGISKDTFYDWIKNKPDFSDAIKEAEAKLIARNVQLIATHALKNWQAAAWMLERKFPEEWGKIDRINVSGKLDPLEVVVVKVKTKDPDAEG